MRVRAANRCLRRHPGLGLCRLRDFPADPLAIWRAPAPRLNLSSRPICRSPQGDAALHVRGHSRSALPLPRLRRTSPLIARAAGASAPMAQPRQGVERLQPRDGTRRRGQLQRRGRRDPSCLALGPPGAIIRAKAPAGIWSGPDVRGRAPRTQFAGLVVFSPGTDRLITNEVVERFANANLFWSRRGAICAFAFRGPPHRA